MQTLIFEKIVQEFQTLQPRAETSEEIWQHQNQAEGVVEYSVVVQKLSNLHIANR